MWGIKLFLRKCIKHASAFVILLKDLRPSTAEARLRESKRSKIETYVSDERLKICLSHLIPSRTSRNDLPRDLSRLTFLAEALANHQLPGSLELVSELLEVLGQVVNGSTTSQSDTGYTEQLLMSAVDSAASQVKVRLSDVFVVAFNLDNPTGVAQPISKYHTIGCAREVDAK